MPILTADNLETRSRQARFAIDRCSAAPASVEELRLRIASRLKSDATRAVAYVFGPVTHSLRATKYGPHFALGVNDHEAYSAFASLGSAGLRSIEQVLTSLLEKFPKGAGHDIVFATIPIAGETWLAGLKHDGHLRECHAKARQAARNEGLQYVWYAL